MLESYKTDNPKVPVPGRASLYFNESNQLNQIDSDGNITPVGGVSASAVLGAWVPLFRGVLKTAGASAPTLYVDYELTAVGTTWDKTREAVGSYTVSLGAGSFNPVTDLIRIRAGFADKGVTGDVTAQDVACYWDSYTGYLFAYQTNFGTPSAGGLFDSTSHRIWVEIDVIVGGLTSH